MVLIDCYCQCHFVRRVGFATFYWARDRPILELIPSLVVVLGASSFEIRLANTGSNIFTTFRVWISFAVLPPAGGKSAIAAVMVPSAEVVPCELVCQSKRRVVRLMLSFPVLEVATWFPAHAKFAHVSG